MTTYKFLIDSDVERIAEPAFAPHSVKSSNCLDNL